MQLWYTEEKPSCILASEPTRKLESKLNLRYQTANNHGKRHSNSGGRGRHSMLRVTRRLLIAHSWKVRHDPAPLQECQIVLGTSRYSVDMLLELKAGPPPACLLSHYFWNGSNVCMLYSICSSVGANRLDFTLSPTIIFLVPRIQTVSTLYLLSRG